MKRDGKKKNKQITSSIYQDSSRPFEYKLGRAWSIRSSLKSYFLSDNSFHVWTADEETQLLLLPPDFEAFSSSHDQKGEVCWHVYLKESVSYSTESFT